MTLHIVVNLLFFMYVLNQYRRQRFDLIDVHITCCWITVFLYHTVEYYLRPTFTDDDVLLLCFVILFVYLLALWLIRTFLPQKMIRFSARLELLHSIPQHANLVNALVLSAFVLAFYLSYGYLFASASVERSNVSYFSSSVLKLVPPLVFGIWAAFIAQTEPRMSRYNLVFLTAFSPSLFVFVFFQGRRTMFYFALLTAIIVLERSRYQVKRLLPIGLLFLILPMAFDAYQSVRENPYNKVVIERTSRNDFDEKIDGIKALADAREDYESTWDSLHKRQTPMAFLYRIVQVTRENERYSDGAVLLNSILAARPRVLFPDKGKVKSSEEVIGAVLGVPVDDYANSYLAEMFADFGFFGVLLAAVLIALIPAILFFINSRAQFPLTTIYCFGASYLFLAEIESTTIGYGTSILHVFIFILLDWLLAGMGIYKLLSRAPAPA